MNIPGQGMVLQGLASTGDPSLEQSSPPFSGNGLVQQRCLYWVPAPHVLVQIEKKDQSP